MNAQQTPGAFVNDTEGVWFGLDAETYHKAPGVSQSRLKEFDEFASPLHYKARKPKTVTEDMEFGTIMHTAILEPEKLDKAFHVQPEFYPVSQATASPKKKGALMAVAHDGSPLQSGVVVSAEQKPQVFKPWHGGADWCKDWLKAHSDRPVIEKEKAERIPKIVRRVQAIPEVADALKVGQREVSWFKRDDITGLLCKCRLDLTAVDLTNDETWIFDLKKVQSGAGGFEQFRKDALDRGYHIQAASYMQITGASRFVFVVYDDNEPFDAVLWEMDRDTLRLGAAEYRRILNRFAECVKSDRWPGYAGGIGTLTLPWWGAKRLEELIS